mmetsp:Transcript_8672/g.22646  ORF Transcript_8672/g.22646 Transcript_8672/m.22646 type:complete len:83 (-) Transcript_8672:75-323(-)
MLASAQPGRMHVFVGRSLALTDALPLVAHRALRATSPEAAGGAWRADLRVNTCAATFSLVGIFGSALVFRCSGVLEKLDELE